MDVKELSIYQKMAPFVTGTHALKQPEYSMWCVSVCWDIILGTCVCIGNGLEDVSDLENYHKGYGIYYLKNGFVANLINEKRLLSYSDPRLTGQATLEETKVAVLQKLAALLRSHVGWYAVQLALQVPSGPLFSPLVDNAIGAASYMPGGNVLKGVSRVGFVMPTYETSGASRGSDFGANRHRVIVAGKDRNHFYVANPEKGTEPYAVAIGSMGFGETGATIVGLSKFSNAIVHLAKVLLITIFMRRGT
jgi:hypothetical protein